jgi:hypothetical protein
MLLQSFVRQRNATAQSRSLYAVSRARQRQQRCGPMAAPSLHSISLCGLPTTVFFQAFADRLFLVVTQQPTFGALLEARVDAAVDGAEEPSARVLLGARDDDFAALAARRLLESFRGPAPGLPLLLALGLRAPADMGAVRELVAAVEGLRLLG